jgi:hypothetical protein
LAYRMAVKSFEDEMGRNFSKPRSHPAIAAMREKVQARKAKGGRAYQISTATVNYVGDVTATSAKGMLFRSFSWIYTYQLSQPSSHSSIMLRMASVISHRILFATIQRGTETR